MYNKLLSISVLYLASLTCAANDGFITGDVRGLNGEPEAGVWIIAETDDLPTEYRKIVVSDERGRFVLPALPAAEYAIWVRGYGLIDSDKVIGSPGDTLALRVSRAASSLQAAKVYPSNYWLSLLQAPPKNTFNETTAPYVSQAGWLSQLKLNCVLCHQLGDLVTRLSSAAAFDHGFQKAGGMNYFADALGRERLLGVLADWGSRIKEGEVPNPPPRPRGIERNVVITQWAWGDSYTYAHDQIASDKRDPTRYANGPVYGVDLGNDYLLKVDPTTHRATRIKVPTRDGFATPWCEQTHKKIDNDEIRHFGFGSLGCPTQNGITPHTGRYINPANPHNPMLDASGKVWMTSQIRRQWDEDVPEFCRRSPVIANNLHHRQLAYFDTLKDEFVPVDTCFGTHHLQFDKRGIIWASGDDHVIGWFDPAKFDPSDPATLASAQGWSEVTIDSDGDGEADRAVVGFHYGIIPNDIDNTVWSAVPPGISSPPGGRGHLQRYDPVTDRHEVYTPPLPGFGPRGIDVDAQGVIWTALAGSGHVARFDRRACTQTWGTGDQCPEGWRLWETPGPQFKGVEASENDGSTDMHYYLWVDRFDTLGFGHETIVINGTGSDALIVFSPKSETFTMLRIPYPLNTYTRGLDGRIDDPNGGWQGRGLWFTNGLDPIIHSEIPKSYVGLIQLRPAPLAH